MIRQDQCDKVCRILDDVLTNRPTERDSLIVAVRKAFDALEQSETNCSEFPNNWIPCSERLPQEGEVVLTQAKFKDDMKMAVSSRIDYNYWTGWGTRNINIIAWMPLPEPYQEGGEQDG